MYGFLAKASQAQVYAEKKINGRETDISTSMSPLSPDSSGYLFFGGGSELADKRGNSVSKSIAPHKPACPGKGNIGCWYNKDGIPELQGFDPSATHATADSWTSASDNVNPVADASEKSTLDGTTVAQGQNPDQASSDDVAPLTNKNPYSPEINAVEQPSGSGGGGGGGGGGDNTYTAFLDLDGGDAAGDVFSAPLIKKRAIPKKRRGKRAVE